MVLGSDAVAVTNDKVATTERMFERIRVSKRIARR